jgi:hypothetical protein
MKSEKFARTYGYDFVTQPEAPTLIKLLKNRVKLRKWPKFEFHTPAHRELYYKNHFENPTFRKSMQYLRHFSRVEHCNKYLFHKASRTSSLTRLSFKFFITSDIKKFFELCKLTTVKRVTSITLSCDRIISYYLDIICKGLSYLRFLKNLTVPTTNLQFTYRCRAVNRIDYFEGKIDGAIEIRSFFNSLRIVKITIGGTSQPTSCCLALSKCKLLKDVRFYSDGASIQGNFFDGLGVLFKALPLQIFKLVISGGLVSNFEKSNFLTLLCQCTEMKRLTLNLEDVHNADSLVNADDVLDIVSKASGLRKLEKLNLVLKPAEEKNLSYFHHNLRSFVTGLSQIKELKLGFPADNTVTKYYQGKIYSEKS